MMVIAHLPWTREPSPGSPIVGSALRVFRSLGSKQQPGLGFLPDARRWAKCFNVQRCSPRCSDTIRTARSRTSGEYIIGLPIPHYLPTNRVSGKPGAIQGASSPGSLIPTRSTSPRPTNFSHMRAGISFHRGPPASDVVFQHPIMEDPPSLLVDYHSPRRSPTPPAFPKSHFELRR